MITLTEDEKRMVFQLEGCHRYDAIQEIAVPVTTIKGPLQKIC